MLVVSNRIRGEAELSLSFIPSINAPSASLAILVITITCLTLRASFRTG